MPGKNKASRAGRTRQREISWVIGGIALVVGVVIIALVWHSLGTNRSTARVLASVAEVQRISPSKTQAMLAKGKATLYDVRSRDAFAAKHAVGAVSLPGGELDSLIATLPRDNVLILYCT